MTRCQVERIAITGIGMVTSLGRDATATFRRLVAGDIGITASSLDLGIEFDALMVAAVSPADLEEPSPLDGFSQWSRCDLLAYQAAREALTQAGLGALPVELLIGETAGTSREAALDYARVGQDDTEPFLRRMVTEPLGVSGLRFRSAFPQVSTAAVVCSACSSGALAIALGAMRLEQGAVLPQLVGGADSINAITLVGFGALGALSHEPCRPFDAHRQGLNLGEGAAFLVLETETMVRARAGTVLSWLDGYALGSDAHHLTHPEPEGKCASALILAAIRRAGFAPSDLGYINAHGTATLPNDTMESKAIARALGDSLENVRVSSSKGQLGHTLGAAGAIEAALVVQALREQFVLPTAGLTEVAPDCQLTHVMGKGQPFSFNAALSSSFGFGGAGAVLALAAANRESHRPEANSVIPRVFVKTVVTLGASGILRGTQNAELVTAAAEPPPRRLPFEPLDLLVMERSRRFDRLTALTALGATEACTDAGVDSANTGLIVGNAAGDVSRSVEFIKRVRVRGLRGAHPAEFPHLLPSSVSGNASIYVGLQGPVFNVSEVGETAETVLGLAVNCLRSGVTNAMIACTVEAFDEPVFSTLVAAGRFSATEAPPTEGAAFLVLEAEQSQVPSAAGRCELVWLGLARDWEQSLSVTPPTSRSEVLWASGDEAALGAYLTTLGWGDVPRKTVSSRVGTGWHLPGFLYATASARVLAGAADSVLVVTEPPAGRHLALFVRC